MSIEVDIFGLIEIFFVCYIVVQSWLIKNSEAEVIMMKYFIVCVIAARCFFFDECLNEEITGGILRPKSGKGLDQYFESHTGKY